MNKHNMGIILIVVGAIFIISGIILISTKHNLPEYTASEPQVVVVEKHIRDTLIVSTVVEKSESHPVQREQPTVD
ncbi:MAG: hypothetical protein K2I69_07395 [Muribaculaceae bacterium]|nr:hypothetical protein [Muribaculaceae bacterium]